MHERDLTDGHNAWHPLASFRLLAVMLWPHNQKCQQQFQARLEKDTGIDRQRRPRINNEYIEAAVRKIAPKAHQAGDLVLYMLQLHAHHPPASLNRAVAIQRAAIPPFEQECGTAWHEAQTQGRLNADRGAVLRSFERYRTVSHLWAARMIAETEGWPDLLDGSVERLPDFLSLAAAIAHEAQEIYLATCNAAEARRKRPLLEQSKLWRFRVPLGASSNIRLSIPSLLPRADTILRQYSS